MLDQPTGGAARPQVAAAGQAAAPDGAASHEAVAHVAASAVLRSVVDGAPGESVSIRDIVNAFGERAFGFVLILFSLPNCVPMPPGVAGVVGWPVLLFGVQMMLGHRRPWLPEFVLRRCVPVSTFRRVVDMAEPRLQRLEAYCRPRYTQFFGPTGDRLIGLFAVLTAISVLIPFPGTNFPPSIALVTMSIAVMQEDGVVLAGGLAIGLAGLAYTAAVTGAAYHLAKAALTGLFGL